MADFSDFAGQLVADGIASTVPLNNLDEAQVVPAIDAINGMSVKIGKVLIDNTQVFGDPIGAVVTKMADRFGAGIEMARFKTGAVNKIRGASCFPSGTVPMEAQIAYTNFAYNIELSIGDREVDKALLSADEAGKYAAEKLRTAPKTVAQMHYAAWKELLVDVVDGTKTIASTDRSDGAGSVVSYATGTISGYAGVVDNSSLVVPAPVVGTLTVVSGSEAIDFVMRLEGAAADMKHESAAMNKLAVEAFVEGMPVLFAETKTLNALDQAWAVAAGYEGLPTMTARQYLGKFAEIVEIDKFPAMPVNGTYTGKRVGAILIDKNALLEVIKYEDVESMRCGSGRSNNYSFQGESIMVIKKYCNSYALLVASA